MQCKVKETIHSLFGIRPILNAILEQVVDPLRHLKYGKPSTNVEAEDITSFGNTPPPKFILLTGLPGCGKGAVASAIVNELRRGPGNKTGDTYYSHRKVNFLGWDRTSWDVDLMGHLQNIFEGIEMSENMTVLLFREFDSVCPIPPPGEPDYRLRHALRRRRTAQANFISELCRQLDTIPIGKVLVIGSTPRPEGVSKDVLSRLDHTFHLPLPNHLEREELLWNFLGIENAVLFSESGSASKLMDSLVDSTTDYSAGDLQHIVRASVALARSRTGDMQDSNEVDAGHIPTTVEIQDFHRYLDVDLEEVEGDVLPDLEPEPTYVLPERTHSRNPPDRRSQLPWHYVLPSLIIRPPPEEIRNSGRIPPSPHPVNQFHYEEAINNEINVEDVEEGELDELDRINDLDYENVS